MENEHVGEYERCIMCGELTNVLISMPIDLRKNYEVGLGQLCEKCAQDQYGSSGGSVLSYDQILFDVEQSRMQGEK